MTTELTLLSRVAYQGREITGPRSRGLLALLAGGPRTGCSTARLVEGLWPDERPANPAKALQVVVSRARAQLGADVIAGTPTGYRLTLAEEQIDASAVLLEAAASAKASRDGDHAGALAHAEAGLALWDGAPEVGEDDPVAALRADRASAYRALVRTRALALARLGRHAEAFDALTKLVDDHPRDEELLLELLRCEAATAGPSAALVRYDAYRRALRDELGTDPGDALRELNLRLLQDDAPAVRHGIPHEPNPLLGRDADLANVAALLRSSRVVSITGPGGLGKTRLAHAVAREAGQRVVHVVALAGAARDEDVAAEVAAVLGAGDARRGLGGPADPLTGIVRALGPGPALLVLDNCEHVVAAAAELARALVAMTRDLRILTTSRAPLGLSSEAVYPLPELDLDTAVELFGQRARAARPDADLSGAVELCRRLDGLPLAVELAAARVRVMSVPEITRRLDDRFALLRGGARDAPERHHTLRAVVDWSWNLLGPDGRAALRTLSILPGGFTADTARHLLGDDAVLEDLAGQSLLKVADTGAGVRFRMLETVREFGALQRAAAGADEDAARRLLAWARDFGAAHHAAIFGPDPLRAVELVRAEQDNLALALRLGLARPDADASVVAVAAVLIGLWIVDSDYLRLARLPEEVAAVLTRFRPEPGLVEATRAALVLSAGIAIAGQGARGLGAVEPLRALPPAPPDTLIRAAAVVVGEAPGLAAPGRPALRALCDRPEPLLAGVANMVGGYLHEHDDDLDAALAATGRALTAFAGPETPWMLAMAHSRYSELCLRADRGEEARRHMRSAQRMLESLRAWPEVGGLRWGMVLATLQSGDVDEAERWLELADRDEMSDAFGAVSFKLGAQAEIALARGRTGEGLRLWRGAVERLTASGIQPPGQNPALDAWALEVRSAALVAHARHGRADLVGEIAAELPERLAMLLGDPDAAQPAFVVEPPLWGAVLLAVAMTDLHGGDARAVRMVALAERLGFLRNFQPTMSTARARADAEKADRRAYADAVSEYARLRGREQLREAALAALRARG
ncbi:ATP-binding protein [Actinomadura macrotermitis]|uniref:Bacterial transcriptional activator domain-containing protein n=1 Tax=Actinomadura macrotermitis TaxID=2585200 RepID=A0A7K0BQY8_9ACTN|nr:hypothetical protein [Actinomadura macrotermitis]